MLACHFRSVPFIICIGLKQIQKLISATQSRTLLQILKSKSEKFKKLKGWGKLEKYRRMRVCDNSYAISMRISEVSFIIVQYIQSNTKVQARIGIHWKQGWLKSQREEILEK